MQTLTLESRYEGALIFAAAGDALGWITEFERDPAALSQKYGVETIERFTDWRKRVGGPYLGYEDFVRAGSYSDDTQLTLAVARCIGPDGQQDLARFAKLELPAWLLYDRGGGRTVKAAAGKAARKSASWNANFFNFKAAGKTVDYRDCGANGVAMRVAPLALALASRPGEGDRAVFMNGIVTHGHPRALLGAILLARALALATASSPAQFADGDALAELAAGWDDLAQPAFLAELPIEAWIAQWNEAGERDFFDAWHQVHAEVSRGLADLARALGAREADATVLDALGCRVPASRGSGTVTVLGALYLALRYAHAPRAGVLAGVNLLGADTDSLAAMAGAMLGALHGAAALPPEWREVQDHAYLVAIARGLAAIAQGLPTSAVGRAPSAQSDGAPAAEPESLHDRDWTAGERVRFEPLGSGTVVGAKRLAVPTRGKHAALAKVVFDVGQSCMFARIRAD